jgi:hypothetical protein
MLKAFRFQMARLVLNAAALALLLGAPTVPAAFAGHCSATQHPTCAHLVEPGLYRSALGMGRMAIPL